MADNNSYKWKKYANGIGSVAIVDLNAIPSALEQNQIIEHYSGQGFIGQGYLESVAENGYDSWKIAARHGLEYAFALVSTNWIVTINKIEGRTLTDTNPTIVGYTVLRAFFDKIGFELDNNQIETLEAFVLSSWAKPYKELIPNFFNLSFTEHLID